MMMAANTFYRTQAEESEFAGISMLRCGMAFL